MTTVSHDDTRKTLRILVVEPDDDTRALYSQSLQFDGYDVVEASDGRDALVKALAQSPALVMTEARLPMFDGYALCEVLRRDATTRTVPILVITTQTRPADLERARAAGADAILVKPAAPDAVLNEVRRLLAPSAERYGKSKTLRATAPEHQGRSAHLSARSDVHPGRAHARAHLRFESATPPARPPDLICPSCDCPLVYRRSHIGGVSSRHPEQWDDYACPSSCGIFQYRQRTRKLRRVGDA